MCVFGLIVSSVVLGLPSVTPDVCCEHIGPCYIWTARTVKGDRFLKSLPARFRAPYVTVAGGEEKLTGERSEYDPKIRSVAPCPPLQTELIRSAKASGLRIKEDD